MLTAKRVSGTNLRFLCAFSVPLCLCGSNSSSWYDLPTSGPTTISLTALLTHLLTHAPTNSTPNRTICARSSRARRNRRRLIPLRQKRRFVLIKQVGVCPRRPGWGLHLKPGDVGRLHPASIPVRLPHVRLRDNHRQGFNFQANWSRIPSDLDAVGPKRELK